MRRTFLTAFHRGVRLLWPIFSGLLLLVAGLGALVGAVEGWGMGQGLYFAYVTALTIGYGDLVPSRLSTRVIAAVIGIMGVVTSGLVAGVAVAAIQDAVRARERLEEEALGKSGEAGP
ncbi:MAG: potassium channel family protein [Roseococcus sp.]|nr:potassium channel family protein [Roseococcus sp.]